MTPNTIGLLMIVRDEAPVIARAIDSVKCLIDKYLICDTGSKDETPQIIEREMRNIPGKIIFKEWINYGANRSYLMEEAQKYLDTEFFLLLDADEVLQSLDFAPLTQDDRLRLLSFAQNQPEISLFSMTTHYKYIGKVIEYPRYQFLRNDQLYKWELPYHEELISTKSASSAHIPFIINFARKEGYNSRNPGNIRKHLQEYFDWLQIYPNHVRAIFYIARTCQDLKDINNAIIWYEKRLQLQGKSHEIYVSLISLGRLYISRKQYDKAEEKLKSAILQFPFRLEPYYILMCLYANNLHQYDKAFNLGKSVPSNLKPNPLDSFVEINIYKWEFQYKLGIIAFHINKEQGKHILRELLRENKIPSKEIDSINVLLGNATTKTVNINSYIGTGAAFKEFTLLLIDTLSEMGYSYTTSKEIKPDMLNIVIGACHTPDYYLQKELPTNTIIVNLEQLYDGCIWEGKYINLLSKYRVWDYNQSNIQWLAKKGIKAELFHRLHSPRLETIKQLPEEQKDIDVLFYGASTTERKFIAQFLRDKLPSKKIIFIVGVWAEQRDQLIARSKIVLNIHGYPSNIFESSRVGHLLSNSAFVISEKSVNDGDYPEFEGGLIRVERSELVETVAKYLEVPEERKRIAAKGYESVKTLKCSIPSIE